MRIPRPTTFALRHGAAALACVMIVSCGGDDDADSTESDPPVATGDAGGADDTGSDENGALADNAARDSVLDVVGSESDVDLDSAIASLSPQTRYGIAAGQMDPEPDVEIDGTSIRLVFGDGSVANAFMSCILASAIQSADETVTLVYPDGDKVC